MTIDWVQAGGIIATLVVLETVLSFDNAAILAVMSRKLPPGSDRRRALNYGLAIAYGLRILAILLAVLLLRFPWFLTIGGAYLLFLFGRHFWGVLRRKEEHAPRERAAAKGAFGLSPLALVVVQIGVVDLAFALDQVVAAVAFTNKLPVTQSRTLIIVAATIGLVSLRLLASFMSRLMDWLPLLEHMAFVAVGFVGALLVLENPLVVPPRQAIANAVEPIKIPVTLGLFLVPILIKLVFKVPRTRGGHAHASSERAIEAAQPIQIDAAPEPLAARTRKSSTKVKAKGKPKGKTSRRP